MTLLERLFAEIRRDGPITFARFMELALYDAEEGFYAQPPIGEPARGGHFVTSPHVSPAFADLLARQLAECWESLRRPDPYTVVEIGAGDGTLALQILQASRSVPDLAGAMRYVAVEATAGQEDALRSSGLETARSLREVGRFTGCAIANEVLDNLPFHVLRRRDGRVVEVRVGCEGDRLVEVEGEPSPEALAMLDGAPETGEDRRVSPAAAAMVRDVAASLKRGYSFFFDYAAPGPVHGYRDHRAVREVLADPGSNDITAAVDLEAVATEARREGLQVWGPISQREALLGLGLRLWVSGVRARQAEAETAGDWRAANRYYEARSRASILVDEAKLGGLQLVAFATPELAVPAAALGDRETGC